MTHQLARRLAAAVALGLLTLGGGPDLSAQPPGKGKQGDAAFAADRDAFHFLLDHRKDVRRTVKDPADGVETLTESDDVVLAKKIREYVAAMHRRVKEGKGIHYRDPLFAEIFRHADKIAMKIEETARGVKVTETSTDPYVSRLIQAHAAVVTKFVENGHAEVRQNHAVPARPGRKKP